MDPMLEAFISESRDLLETAGRCFLALEDAPDDPERLNELFRAMHTIKGSSGLFEIQPLTRVVHAAEDVLDVIREGRLRLDPAMTDLFLEAMDQVGIWLDDLEASGELGAGAGTLGEQLSGRLRALIGDGDGDAECETVEQAPGPVVEEPAAAPSAPPTSPVRAPSWLEGVPEEVLLELYRQATADGAVAVEYLPAEQCFFSGDDPILTAVQCPGRAWLGVAAREPWPGAGEFDPYQCRLRLRLLSGAGAEALREHFRYVEEEVEITPLPASLLVSPRGVPGEPELYRDFVDLATDVVERGAWTELPAAVEPLLELGSPELLQSSALRWLDVVVRSPEPDAALARALVCAVAEGRYSPPAGGPASPGETPLREPPSHPLTGEARELLWAQVKLLSLQEEAGTAEGNVAAVCRVLAGVLPALGREADLATVEACRSLPAAEAATKLSRLLLDLSGEEAEAEAGTDECPVADRQAAEELLRAQLALLRQPAGAEGWEGMLASGSRVIRAALRALGAEDALARLDDVVARARRERDAAPLRELIEESIRSGANTAAPTPVAAPAASPSRTPAPAREAGGGGERRQGSTVLKVDQARIDALMDLVGELVVAKNALPYLARQAEEEYACAPLAKAIKAQYAVINRIAEELQAAVMQVRMVPVSTVFQRFPRLVRDLSRKLDKRIRLVLEGEETEIDKNVVEDLPDPLVHLVRNSIDHGIEPPEQREAAGKPAEGTITLRATQLDDQVLIEISDDGKGIDPEVIKRKAYEKGLIDEERLDRISDQEALQLILAPGFSTAEQVTDLSGRGVGMDVVNSMVARVGGTVSVDSRPGLGSTIRLSLPLSMAVSRVMMVDAGGDSFGVPMEAITETVKVPGEAIQRIKDRELVVLRDRLIPLLCLRRVLELEQETQAQHGEVAVLVVRIEGQELGLVVDRFHAGMDVILKPLEGILSGFRHFSGTALLGDGRVLLVLNLMELQRCL